MRPRVRQLGWIVCFEDFPFDSHLSRTFRHQEARFHALFPLAIPFPFGSLPSRTGACHAPLHHLGGLVAFSRFFPAASSSNVIAMFGPAPQQRPLIAFN
jgi:hypothetical protein